MSAAHTPGPWSIPNNSQFYVSNGASWVACAVGIRGEEGEANARLIAAAPDLLEALQLADATLRGANMNRDVVERKVTAAIAKATEEPS